MDDHRALRPRFVPLLLLRRFSTSQVRPPPPPPRPVSFRARPVLYISTFLILHQSITAFSLIPAYTYFSLTDSSSTFLAGPYAAFILRQPIPFSRGERTVEDLAEALVRRSVRVGWRMWGRWRGRKVDKSEENEVAEEVVEGLEGKRKWRDRVADRTRGGMERLRAWKEARAERTGQDVVTNGGTERPSGITLRHAMDAAAAYLFVKTIFPVRLAASVFLTPKLARVFGRRWR